MIKQVRKFITIAAISYFAASAPIAHAAKDTIRLGLQSVPTDLLYQAKDWAAPYELSTDIATFSSAGDSLKAFLAGRVDIVTAGAARLVTMADVQPEKFYVVGVSLYGGDRYGLVVGAKSTYQNIHDLKGKKIGVVPGAASFATFMKFIEINKMTPKDFQFINMKVEDISSAVSHGVIDAGLSWEPQVAIAEVSGMVRRIASLKGVNESPVYILASRSYAQSNPEGLVKFLASANDVAQFIKNSPDEADQLIAKELGKSGVEMDPKAIRLAVSRMTIDLELKPELIEELTPMAESMLKSNHLKKMPDFKAVINDTFYRKAMALSQSKHSK